MERIGRLVSRSIQTNLEISCEHQLCVAVFQNWLLQQQQKDENYFNLITGFNECAKVRTVLGFVPPEVDLLKYYLLEYAVKQRAQNQYLFII